MEPQARLHICQLTWQDGEARKARRPVDLPIVLRRAEPPSCSCLAIRRRRQLSFAGSIFAMGHTVGAEISAPPDSRPRLYQLETPDSSNNHLFRSNLFPSCHCKWPLRRLALRENGHDVRRSRSRDRPGRASSCPKRSIGQRDQSTCPVRRSTTPRVLVGEIVASSFAAVRVIR